jgi:hypothetical protein
MRGNKAPPRVIDPNVDSTWPRAIAALPRDKRGYPITYVTYIGADGIPDFRILDAERRFRCYEQRLCAVCGEKLGYWIVFISGPECEKTRMFLDPPMHPDCADFALAVCPHLINERARYSLRPAEVEMRTFANEVHPTVFKRFRTRGYELMRFDGDIIIKSSPFVEVTLVKRRKH